MKAIVISALAAIAIGLPAGTAAAAAPALAAEPEIPRDYRGSWCDIGTAYFVPCAPSRRQINAGLQITLSANRYSESGSDCRLKKVATFEAFALAGNMFDRALTFTCRFNRGPAHEATFLFSSVIRDGTPRLYIENISEPR
jgi:hypothetical protein